ncbi:SIMPL domain-containing protein [Sphingobacterium daejeonense]|uniref:SIMPL domain-containing protein n=1 Tax=Sphingobacterium daejeonense TaxID=371142 RepID=UPI0010C300D2|nr:SIMPL domain-containing protein [Sphingobacterium daejeonense]VTP86183.1 oxidative stress defense protein [Sphingobacterium daejeonense]
MKKFLTLIALFGMLTAVNAQTNNMENTRRVATRGYAEKEITPDIVYLSISLKEYYQDGNTKKKVAIDQLEKQLFDAAMKNGVKKEDFTVQNIYSYNVADKKKNNELLQARQYRIKVADLKKLNTMLEEVDARGLQSTNISGYDHSQKREIEKELKTLAVRDARTNAEILAAADAENVGKVILINDNSSFNWNEIAPQPRMYALKASNAEMDSANNGLDLEVRPIKLTCNIDAVFELK